MRPLPGDPVAVPGHRVPPIAVPDRPTPGRGRSRSAPTAGRPARVGRDARRARPGPPGAACAPRGRTSGPPAAPRRPARPARRTASRRRTAIRAPHRPRRRRRAGPGPARRTLVRRGLAPAEQSVLRQRIEHVFVASNPAGGRLPGRVPPGTRRCDASRAVRIPRCRRSGHRRPGPAPGRRETGVAVGDVDDHGAYRGHPRDDGIQLTGEGGQPCPGARRRRRLPRNGPARCGRPSPRCPEGSSVIGAGRSVERVPVAAACCRPTPRRRRPPPRWHGCRRPHWR